MRVVKLSGKISDKLRALFGPSDPGWNPSRSGMVQPKRTQRTKIPRGVEGHSIKGRHKKR